MSTYRDITHLTKMISNIGAMNAQILPLSSVIQQLYYRMYCVFYIAMLIETSSHIDCQCKYFTLSRNSLLN